MFESLFIINYSAIPSIDEWKYEKLYDIDNNSAYIIENANRHKLGNIIGPPIIRNRIAHLTQYWSYMKYT